MVAELPKHGEGDNLLYRLIFLLKAGSLRRFFLAKITLFDSITI